MAGTRTARGGEPRRHREGGRPSSASTAGSSAPASSRWRPSRTRSTGCARSVERGAASSATTRCSSTATRCAPRSTRPPIWPAPGTATAPRWSTRRGWRGACVRPACARRAHRRGHPGPLDCAGAGPASRSGRPDGDVRGRPRGARPPTRSRALLRRMRPFTVPVYDYALVTEPLSPAQLASDRLAQPAGPRRRRQPVPLLPPHRRQPHPLGRLRRRSTTAQRPARRARPAAATFETAGRTVLRHVPAARRAAVQPPLGRRDRHLAPGSSPSSAPRSAAGWPTASATPGSASGASRFGAQRHARPARRARHARRWGCGPCARDRCRSRRNRCAGPASSSPAARSRAPTATSGRRGPWLRLLDRLGMGFDS